MEPDTDAMLAPGVLERLLADYGFVGVDGSAGFVGPAEVVVAAGVRSA